VFDAIQRSTKTLEDGYHLMSLNEMGCGALGGTSWPIDRDLVTRYLGMEGLIENANDASCYTDGYLVVACGLTNVTNIASRMALEMSYWSGVEYGFLEIGSHGTSFMMPQKSTNPNSIEMVRFYAGEMIRHLTGVAVAGLREPHGDTQGMLRLALPTLDALELTEKSMALVNREMHQMQVHKERMLSVIRESYICATELANQMVRDYDIGYRTAHDIVKDFVLTSRKQKIPATKARVKLLDEAAQKVLGRKLGMTEARLRELLDPEYFINVTNSKGGVAPQEVTRMIADRRRELADARARHMKRIETLEKAQEQMLADLKATCSAVR
jgi:argininosuccinate lyase